MKANDFIKKFGLEYAKHILLEESVILVDLDYENLKRLVESHELVEKHGGIDSLNDLFCVYSMRSVRLMAVGSLTYARAMQAIADVENCQRSTF